MNTSYGWVIFRNTFPWVSKRRPEIKELSITMEQEPEWIPGAHFKTHAPGDSFTFFHPISGTDYTLTVQELEQQTLPKNFGSERWFYPTHYTAMSYTLSPEPVEDISFCDCDEGDRPVEIKPSEDALSPAIAASVGCIGSADGPTAIVFGENSQGKFHVVYSALHFKPIQDDIEWLIMFSVKQFDDASFLLI